MRLPIRRPVTLSLLASLAIGCGAKPGVSTPKNEIPVRPLPAPGAWHGPGIDAYAAPDGLAPDEAEQRLALDIGRAIVPPPALDCLAREYAARFGADGQDPDPGTVAALAHHCGYWTLPIQPHSVTAPDAAALTIHVRALPPAAFEGTVGLGVVPHPDGRITLTLLRDPGELILDAPVPRGAASADLRGRLIRGDGQLEMWIDGADGPRRTTLEVADTGRFSGVIPAGARRVELALKRGRFRRTLALFDRGPRPDAHTPPAAVATASLDTRAAADAVTARINALRAEAGAPPLVHERRLDTVLDDWMHRIADGTAEDAPPGMLDERGWPYARLRYAISSGAHAEQLVDLLVETPTGRRAVLTDEVDRLAIGLRPFASGRGFDAVFAAVQTFSPVPAPQARATLLAGLNGARERDGAGPLAASTPLDEIAQRLAEDALNGRRPWAEVVPGAMEAVKKERLIRGGFAAGAFPTVLLDTAPFDQEPSAMNSDMGAIGIGIASGPLPGGGAPRHLIVYVVAERVAVDEI